MVYYNQSLFYDNQPLDYYNHPVVYYNPILWRTLPPGLLQSELTLRQLATDLLQSPDSLLQSPPMMSALDRLSCISLSLFPHKNKAAKVA